MSWHQDFNQAAIAAAQSTGQALNDAASYGVRIVETTVPVGAIYWRVIGIHHLIPDENRSNHHTYLEALDETGQRVRNPNPWAGWSWEGRRPDESAPPIELDKPASEPAANIPMSKGQKVMAHINGLRRDANDLSDQVEGMHTVHPDERGPHGEIWNSIGHHSFYIVFQRTLKSTAVPADGVIAGSIAGGRGYRVRLFQEQRIVAEQTVDDTLAFRFANLPLGSYRLEATGPSIGRDPIQIDAEHKQVEINLQVP